MIFPEISTGVCIKFCSSERASFPCCKTFPPSTKHQTTRILLNKQHLLMTASFWGLVVEPNKLYSQVVPAGFKLSMASLGPQEESKSSNALTPLFRQEAVQDHTVATTLMVRLDEKDDYALCSLTPGHLNQQALDLVFTEGENIALRVVGDQPVHLTGYYLPDEINDDCDMESDEEGYMTG